MSAASRREAPGNSAEISRLRSPWSLTAVLALLFLTVAGSGMALYQSAREELFQNNSSNLASISELKVSQIESWLDDSRHTLNQTVSSPWFMRTLQAWLQAGKGDAGLILPHLKNLAAAGRFREVSLYDADGRLLLSTDPALSPAALRTESLSGEMVFDDFHVLNDRRREEIVVGLTRALYENAHGRPVAWVHVTLDHARRLLPLLQQWPGASLSGETLLLRREGDQIVYLSPPRHYAGPPLSLRVPAAIPNSLVGQLVEGARGGLGGVDYRQVPGIGYGLPVPDTPWFVMSKIDEDEAYANLDMRAKTAAGVLLVLLLLAASAVAIRHRYLVASHRRQLEQLQLAKRYEILVRYANDCIIISDDRQRIVDVNQRCLSTYGYRREEMLGMGDSMLLAGETPAAQPVLPSPVDGQAPLFHEGRHRRKDGSVFPVEISEVFTEIDGERQIHKIVRDITERKADEARIARLSSLLATLSAVNHAIAHATGIEEVFDITCRACVEAGKFKLAWIGLADPAGGRLRIANTWGAGLDFLAGMEVDLDPESPERHGPSAIAFHRQRTCISNDFARDPITQPWRELAARCGIGAAVSLPISRDGVPIGVLTAYSEQANSFDLQAEHLLGEIAEGLSFAMHHFAEQEARQEAEAARRHSEKQLLRAERVAHLGHWEIRLDSGKVVWSPQMFRLFERDPELGPLDPRDVHALHYMPDSARLTGECLRRAIATGERIQLEQELHFPGERTTFHASLIVPVRDEHGDTVVLHGTIQDITERKMNEVRLAKMASRLAQSAREYEDLYQQAPCGYHSLDRDGVFQRINDTELKWLGYTRAEVVGKMKFIDLLPAERVPGFLHHYPLVIEQGQVRDLEQSLICKDGSVLPVLINATVIRDEAGRFLMTRSTAYNMSERKKIEKEREEHARRLAHLSQRLVNMQEEERRRLSAALHDHTSPNLAAIGLNLSTIALTCKGEMSPGLAERLEDIRALIEDTTAKVREISTELRPPLLDYAGLVPALDGYLYQFSKRTGTSVRFEHDRFAGRPAPEIETVLFRVAQEALTNCAKHAGASAVDVRLEGTDGRIRLDIRDNGAGFDPESLGRNGKGIGLGMLNMREMVEFAGGRFALEARPGQGTSIHVDIR